MRLLFILALLLPITLFSQNSLTKAELYIDEDPGYGKGEEIAISNGELVSPITYDISSYGEGFHTLQVRTKSNTGFWSQTQRRVFYIERKTPEIVHSLVYAEYYVDEDPGYEKAHSIPVGTDGTISGPIAVDLTNETEGFHTLQVRTKSSSGFWSQTQARVFYIDRKTPEIEHSLVYAEYFVDKDPGYGEAENIPVGNDGTISGPITIDLTNESEGFHTLQVRTKSSSGFWSQTQNRVFYKMPVVKRDTTIAFVEYFLDKDPGFGNGNRVINTKKGSFQQLIEFDLDTVSRGEHTLYVRAKDKNGAWGFTRTTQFCNGVVSEFAVNEFCCKNTPIDIVNLSSRTNTETQYSWDFTTDGTIDSHFQSDTTIVFDRVGEYEITLIAGEESTCMDTISHTVKVVDGEVEELIISTFSTDVITGKETTIECAQERIKSD